VRSRLAVITVVGTEPSLAFEIRGIARAAWARLDRSRAEIGTRNHRNRTGWLL